MKEQLPYRSLYVHVPFCQGSKCDYCAFYSECNSSPELRRDYLDAIKNEFSIHRSECQPLRSIFIGGGTPSALSASELTELLEAIRGNFALTSDCEWSMEANPESLTAEKLAIAAGSGVNRISLGIQSFQPELRQQIGRRGTLERLPELVSAVRHVGIAALNFDLIYAIPGETPQLWQRDLETALSFAPDHLSCYSLIREEGTPFARRSNAENCDSDSFLECWELNDAILGAAGLPRYEISNFAQPARRCRHNWEIWHGQTYLGCGPAAVSFNGVDRPANPSDLQQWLRQAPQEHDHLPRLQRAREILAFALRTVDGWSWSELQDATGFTSDQLSAWPEIQRLQEDGLLIFDSAGLRPTPQGLLFNDTILEELI